MPTFFAQGRSIYRQEDDKLDTPIRVARAEKLLGGEALADLLASAPTSRAHILTAIQALRAHPRMHAPLLVSLETYARSCGWIA